MKKIITPIQIKIKNQQKLFKNLAKVKVKVINNYNNLANVKVKEIYNYNNSNLHLHSYKEELIC